MYEKFIFRPILSHFKIYFSSETSFKTDFKFKSLLNQNIFYSSTDLKQVETTLIKNVEKDK